MNTARLVRPAVRSFALGIGLCLLAACGGGSGGGGGPTCVPDSSPAVLRDPTMFNATAPATFVARFNTSKGVFRVEVTRASAPIGADRFFNLVRNGYYDDVRFFRVITNFVAQFGLHGDPAVNAVWTQQTLADDPVVQSNVRGTITYAKTSEPNSRTTQVFINLRDNTGLDSQGFAPFGRVIEGMEVVEALYASYGEAASQNQRRIRDEGNVYLCQNFPLLDFVLDATIEP